MKMSEERKNRDVSVNPGSHYGTFQGVANYYPPFLLQPPQSYAGVPRPIPPPGSANPYVYGYQTVTGYPFEEATPSRQRRLCGYGSGWLLFFLGFFFGGIPYIGTFILLCVQVDYREKAGYIACAIASVITLFVVTFGVTKGARVW